MAVHQRRGRRPGLPVDFTPSDSEALDSEVRIGWLLRSSRLHRAPGTSARAFATVLSDLGISVDPSRLSRWETGRLPAPLNVVAGYESALSLPSGGLVALAIVTRKLADPDAAVRDIVASHAVTAEEAQVALDAVVDGTPTGEQWLRLASRVACSPDQVLLPESLWQAVAHRLVRELGLSVGTAYATRNEAAIVLSENPLAAAALVRAIATYVLETDALNVADPIALLQVMPTEPAGDLALSLLDRTAPATRSAAAWTVAAKVLHDHFTPEQLARLETIVTGHLAQERPSRDGTYHSIADLLDVLPSQARERISRTLGTPLPTTSSSSATGDPYSDPEPAHPDPSDIEPADTTPESPEPEGTSPDARLARRVAHPSGEAPDPMLDRLVEEALFHPQPDRRFHASFCLALSPYADRVARGTGTMIEQALFRGHQDRDLAARLLVLMTFVPTPEQRPLLQRVAREAPPPLSARALNALGHLPPRQGAAEEVWRDVLNAGVTDELTLRSALYCTGMTDTGALRLVDGAETLPAWVRGGARWWMREGPAIREPAGWEA